MALGTRDVMGGGVCIGCSVALGSAEEAIPGVRRGKEGPLHQSCASTVEIRLASLRGGSVSGNGMVRTPAARHGKEG